MKNVKTPSESAFDPQHELACQAHQDFYTDPVTGLMVSTRYQHLQRGSCCGSGCRHCPYDGVKGHREILIQSNPKSSRN